MKSLRSQASDLRDLGSMMLEAAEGLLQLADFFGQPEETPAPRRGRPPKFVVAGQESEHTPTEGNSGRVAGYRILTPEDKAGIKKDWESLPPHLRTKENRAALAAKYQCSTLQLVPHTRQIPPNHYQEMAAKRHNPESKEAPTSS